MPARIQKILDVHPYTIRCLWTNGEVRTIDLKDSLQQWSQQPGSVFKSILDEDTFIKVQLDEEARTLYWDGIVSMKDESGKEIPAPLDLCPDVLYGLSKSDLSR